MDHSSTRRSDAQQSTVDQVQVRLSIKSEADPAGRTDHTREQPLLYIEKLGQGDLYQKLVAPIIIINMRMLQLTTPQHQLLH